MSTPLAKKKFAIYQLFNLDALGAKVEQVIENAQDAIINTIKDNFISVHLK